MYNTAIQIHFGTILLLMGVVGMNAAMLLFAVSPTAYARRARSAMPVPVLLIAALLFTGIVMMAVRQMPITLPNVIMILATIGLIVLESKRYKAIRRTRFSQEGALQTYRGFAMKLFGGELAVLMAITLGMVM